MQANRDTRMPARAPASPAGGGEASPTMQGLRGMDFAAQESALAPPAPSGRGGPGGALETGSEGGGRGPRGW